jgi:hypothetical protein
LRRFALFPIIVAAFLVARPAPAQVEAVVIRLEESRCFS